MGSLFLKLPIQVIKCQCVCNDAGIASQEDYHHPHNTIGESELKLVQQFSYLGSIICSDATIDKEIDNRTAKAYRVFGKLHERVWCSKHLKKSTKINVYRAIVLSILLYGSESWVIYGHHLRLLERFHQRCLSTILNIHWTDYVSNVTALEQAEVTSIEVVLLKVQLRWAGHISRMEDHCLPKIVFYSELTTGCSKRSAPKRRCNDSLKHSLSLGHIDYHQWSTLASNQEIWRHIIHNAAVSFENTRRMSLEEKRQCRKNRALLYHLRRPSAVLFATRLLCPVLAFLAISVLVVSVGKAPLKSSFTKPSHDDDLCNDAGIA